MSNFKNKAIDKDISSGLIILLATACGIIVANLYYAQPLIGVISNEIGLSNSSAGLIVTLTQIGYVVGLLFLVPLGDIVENKKLILMLLFLSAFALIAMVFVKSAILLLITSFFIGLGSVAAQVLVPLVSYLSSENARGRVVGNVMSGLLLGIMLARPISSLVADMWGWNAIFALSATVIIVLAFVLSKVLPTRKPKGKTNYIALLNSMWQLLRTTPILRRRAIYHACVFGAFSLFWTTVPLLLSSPAFHFSQTAIALYALVGITGAIAAPIGGRLADLGWTRPATGIALTVVIISLLLPLFIQSSSPFGIGVLVFAAILLDMGVSANLVLSQRLIFSLSPEIRSRLNGLFMAMFFLGGAVGSFIGGWAYALGGWNLTLWIGIAFPTIALLYFASEK
ncbi:MULTISPECIES: MFS transporter [Bacillus cereus group]|uniref:MFS transporter n=1 Tax=Bacillus thuringiensis TaxID=1428 RepID=A0A9W3YLD3_BACTU|nr:MULTISPECIES: MFS transporter [Bacillus cereus group]AMR06013.1 MFS transporter [Bacillus thuringiensis]AYF85426.1 MFS transporter [Bacillus thuringiensis]EEM80558.1 Major facilitator superfamily MFS_1 [Bacillus thuringiensis serovar huazhongensis BGSC 4BD1]MDA2330460.1 MFS transporter [Bacillus cereus]MDA2336136.1 MFS transporter [Bacillus cereus]